MIGIRTRETEKRYRLGHGRKTFLLIHIDLQPDLGLIGCLIPAWLVLCGPPPSLVLIFLPGFQLILSPFLNFMK